MGKTIKSLFVVKNAKKIDKNALILIICVLILSIFGCIMVYSASSYSAIKHYNNEYFFLSKQIVGVVAGIIGLIFFYFFDSNLLKKFKWIVLAVSIIGLILVFIPGIGVENYGARRWISILGFSFQPSELAKFALILFCACELSEKYKKVKKLKVLIPVFLVGAVLCLLIIAEPNMSVTMCMGATLICMLIIGGISKKHFAMFAIPAGLSVPALIISEPYRMKRLMAFIDPWANPKGEGFQLIQSLYALGNGGLFGVGLFNSRQKYLFLPFSESDFIFSIIGEELGLIGCLFIMCLFITMLVCIIKIALNAKDRFGAMFSSGVAILIGIQVAINIAVVTGSIPPTGIPFPFISAGSTSLLVFMSAIGVVLNVDRQSRKSVIQ